MQERISKSRVLLLVYYEWLCVLGKYRPPSSPAFSGPLKSEKRLYQRGAHSFVYRVPGSQGRTSCAVFARQ